MARNGNRRGRHKAVWRLVLADRRRNCGGNVKGGMRWSAANPGTKPVSRRLRLIPGVAKRSEAWPSVPGNIFVRNDQITCIQFSDLLALARHSRPAPAANFIMPGAARVICAHPPDIETNGTVPGHRLTRQDGWRRFFRNVFHLFLFNLTFSLVVELVVLAVGLSVFLPELVRAANDFNLLGSHLLSIP